ncbi:hypothetical protein AAKU67_001180, partial [Oxalobacteraceae bacterium GrIS 2.11]
TFFAFTHLLSSFRRQQLKLPGGYCLKSWIHYTSKLFFAPFCLIVISTHDEVRMKRFIQGENRKQSTLLPEMLDDYVTQENPVRVVDVFIDNLDAHAAVPLLVITCK